MRHGRGLLRGRAWCLWLDPKTSPTRVSSQVEYPANQARAGKTQIGQIRRGIARIYAQCPNQLPIIHKCELSLLMDRLNPGITGAVSPT